MGDLISRKFHNLTVLEKTDSHIFPSGKKCAMYLCKCDCGNKVIVQARNLRNGNTKSCGCIKSLAVAKIHTKHNGAKRDNTERLYNVWKSMISRCYYKSNSRYNRYGGRGIKVCDEWKYSYENFRKWAYDNGYDENADFGKCTIDRINNDGNYEPLNCRWVDMKTQANNTSKNKKAGGIDG